MSQVWIGYSETLRAQELLETYFDPVLFSKPHYGAIFAPAAGPNDPETAPPGELIYGFEAAPLEPGDYEVYDPEDHSMSAFDFQYVLDLFPFDNRPNQLHRAPFKTIKTVFYVKSGTRPKKRSDKNIVITDVMSVKFDWE